MSFSFKKILERRFLLPGLLVLITLSLYSSMFFVFSALDRQEDLDAELSAPFPVLGSDSYEYVKLANNLAAHHVFSGDRAPPFSPNTDRTPGYPLWVALIQSVFGHLNAVSITQIFMTVLTGLLIFGIGKKIFSQGIGFAAALLYILDPVTILHSLIISTEIPFTFLFLTVLYLLFFAEKKAEKKRVFLAGIFLGFAVLVKPIGLFLPFVLIPFLILSWIKTRKMKQILGSLFLFIFGYGCLLSPWIIRNKAATGVAGISAAGLCNIMKANLPKLLAVQRGTSFFDELGRVHSKHHIEKAPCSLENAAQFKKIFYEYLKADPAGYFTMHLKGALLVPLASSFKLIVYEVPPLRRILVKWNLIQEKNLPIASNSFLQGKTMALIRYYFKEARIGIVFLLEHIFWLALSLLAVLAILPRKGKKAGGREQALFAWLFAALCVYFCILISPVPSARYRLLLEPFLLLLAMIGLKRLPQAIRFFRIGISFRKEASVGDRA